MGCCRDDNASSKTESNAEELADAGNERQGNADSRFHRQHSRWFEELRGEIELGAVLASIKANCGIHSHVAAAIAPNSNGRSKCVVAHN